MTATSKKKASKKVASKVTGKAARNKKAQEVRVADRRNKAWELYKTGVTSYRKIGEALKVSRTTIMKDIRFKLDEINAETREVAIDAQAIDLQRLDRLLQAAYPLAITGNLQAIDRVLKILERRARLLGTEGPIEMDGIKFTLVIDNGNGNGNGNDA